MRILMLLGFWALVVSIPALAQANPCLARKEAFERMRKARDASHAADAEARRGYREYEIGRRRYKDGDYRRSKLWDEMQRTEAEARKAHERYRLAQAEFEAEQQAEREAQQAARRAERAAQDAKGAQRGAQGHGGFPAPNKPPAPRVSSGGAGGGTGPKTEPDLGDTLPGLPPGPIYGPPVSIPPIPGGLPQNPFGKVAAGTAGVTDSFWPFPWK